MFEEFGLLLLRREHPGDDVRRYGGTGDGGRDLVHRAATPGGVRVRLVQCKRYESPVGVAVVRKDLAKLWANVFAGSIPDRPDEVVFYVTPRLTPEAQQLLDSQERWRREAGAALAEHLGAPAPADLARFAADWWPTPACEAALSLTDRARKFPDLIEEFFAVRKVIDGGVADVTNSVCQRVLPPLAAIADRVGRIERAVAPVPTDSPVPCDELKAAFARTSAGLLGWATTVAGGHWLDRPELAELGDRVADPDGSVSVVLGAPGSGKSALLARLGQRLTARGTTVLAVKADQLRNTVDTAAKLAEQLGLRVLTHEAVRAVAAAGPVVVLLDQLDALADLADLKSERLHVLLDLVDRLAGHPGVHVVCSCREFEYRHDGRLGRLGRLDAPAVRLRPPTWEQVSAVLNAHGVATTGWPDDARDLLRTPHHLAVFLGRLRGAGEHQAFTTYQQLFNDLWQERVVRPGGGRADLLFDLADHLAEREELWADRGRFDARWATAEALVAADILTPDDGGFRLGFRHQSLFEFTRARSFARSGASLADHVAARQHALFVRPTLWMTLHYLRLADPAAYAHEFDALWYRPDLRRHVKHLLIDFLAQVEQPPPDDREQARLVGALRDAAWRAKVLAAVTGRGVWFRLLAGSVLPAEMRRSPDDAQPVAWVLVAALGSDRDRCLRLLRENWLPDEPKLPLVWHTLMHLTAWDDAAADLAVAVVRGSVVAQGGMWHLAQAMAKDAPVLAVRLVAAWLDAARHRPAGESSTALRTNLESHNEWHDVEKLAKRVPVEFARSVWPAVCDIVTREGGYASAVVVRYADDMMPFARLDRREYVALDSPDQFFLALDAALRTFARTRPHDFLATVDGALGTDSRLVQRLVCRGVRELAADLPDAALTFLTADPRRFWLGGTHDDQGDSIELVAAVAPHLSDEGVARLTAAVRAWEVYRDRDDAPRDLDDVYARGHRFRLLTAIPPDRLPDDVRREIEAELVALPDHVRKAHPRFTGGARLIMSPVSRDELAAHTDAEIAALFDELPDSTESHHPRDWMRGGSVQLSREFQEFVKTHPDRAAPVVARLRPGDQERPAAHAVQGLVEARRPAAEVVEFVRQLDARGFSGEEFRSAVAYSLGDLARDGGLSDPACELLDRWRVAEWSDNDRDEPERADGDPARPTSILWQYGGTVGLPQGRFPVLAALTRGFLCREPHAADRWLAMLSDHIGRAESVTNWRAMTLYLDDLWHCPDRAGVRAFLVRLLAGHPAVFAADLGARLLARVAELLPDDRRRCAYEVVRAWGARHGHQAFGELVGLRHFLHPGDDWAREQVDAALAGPADEWVAVGVAFAAANLWREPECRARATEVLGRLVPHAAAAVGHAVMSVYRTHADLPLDDDTLRLFRAVAAHPEILRQPSVDEAFFDYLADALLVDADLVCRLAEAAVARRGADLRSLAHGLYLAGSVLIDISLRLQRSGGDLRRRGMDLFEALLDLGVSEALDVARRTDLRLATGGDPVRSPRRRRSARSVAS